MPKKMKQPPKKFVGMFRGKKVYLQQFGLIHAYSIPECTDKDEEARLVEMYVEARHS